MTATGGTRQLDLYDVAFLPGGPDRVIDTALVAPVESGRVRVHAPGELAVVHPGRQHPVEAALMDAVGTQGHRSVDTIRWRLAGDDRLRERERTLAAAGLLRRRPTLVRRAAAAGRATTSSGRRALLEARRAAPMPALDGGAAMTVALDGREALPDTALRQAIFERPVPPLPRSSGLGRRLRAAVRRDPEHGIYRTQHTAMGGAAATGFFAGGAGDGGGF